MTTVFSGCPNPRAIPRPRPRVAPVTTTAFPMPPISRLGPAT